MAEWPASGVTDWNTKMLAYLAISHETDGTMKSAALTQAGKVEADGSTVFNTTLTAANTFQDLDLSSVVGSNSAIVTLEIQSGASQHYALKPKGFGGAYASHSNTTSGNSLGMCYFVADNAGDYAYVTIMTDSSGVIQHGSSDNTTTFTVKVVGFIK